MPFRHRINSEGTIDSICNQCFVTIGTSTDESELKQLDAEHTCEPARVAYYHPIDPTARRPPTKDLDDSPAHDIDAQSLASDARSR